MKNISKNQGIALAVYIIGIICVIYLILNALIGGENIANPQAMLPVTDFEASCVLLGIGFIPMLISSIFVIRLFDVKKRLKCLYILIPSLVTFIPFIIIAGTLILMLIKGYLEAFNIL